MKSKLSMAALLGGLLLACSASADDIDQVEFVKRLRQNNLPELAMQYLQKMKNEKTLPKDMVKDFPLEMARLRMEIADSTTDPNKRQTLREEARKFYAEYAKANPGTPGAAEAGLESARVTAANAKSALTRALLEEDANRTAALKGARAQLEAAEKLLKEATDRIQELLVLDRNPKLLQLMLQAQLELALILLDQTQTYGFDGDEVLTRADKGKAALTMLGKLAATENESSPTCWLAKAWVIRANAEMDQFSEGEAAFKKYFSTSKGPLVAPAKRMGHYFLVKLLSRNTQTMPAEVSKAAKEWLDTYNAFRDTPEGQEVRYLRADNLRKIGDEISVKDKQEGEKYYRVAEAVYKDLSQSDGDYTSAARRQRVALLVKLRPELTKGSLDKLRTFEDFFLRAQLEMAQINSDIATIQKKEKDPAKAQAQAVKVEQDRQKTAVEALDKAMGLIKPEVPEADIVDAKYLFVYLLLTQQQPAKAAEQGDEVARKYSKSGRAGTCGAYALHAYTQAIEQAKQQGQKTIDLEEKMHKLAEHLVATWPDDLPADAARHQLGLVAYRTSKFPEAVDQLAKISQAYGDYNQTQYLLAMAALQADKANVPVPKGKDTWKEAASKAYSRIQAPTGPTAKDYNANRFYVFAKIEEAKVLFANKKYVEMEKLLDSMTARINKLDPKDRDQMKAEIGPSIEPLTVYSRYGRCFNLMGSDKPDRYKNILKLLEEGGMIDKLANSQKIAAEIDKKMQIPNTELANAQQRLLANPKDDKAKAVAAKATAELNKLKQERREKVLELDPKLVQALTGFALTANLMEGKTDRAIELLGFIQQSSGGFENQGVILARVVGDIVKLVDDLKTKGNTKDYERTKAQFSAFLQVLAKQPIQKMKPEMIRFLAMSYSALGLHKDALTLLGKIPEPKDEEGLKFYNIVQLMIAREHRLQKDFDKSWEMITKLQKTDFGKRSLDLRKERIQWLMDKKIYGTAAADWSALMKDVRETRVEDYNDALYNYIYCLCMYAETNTKLRADQKANYIERAAKMIAKVEQNDATMGGLRDKYLDLLKSKEALGLRKAYEAEKKALEKQAADAAKNQ